MTPVIVDTSVWRKYFSGGTAASDLRDLLDEHGVVLLHPFILGEMLLGGLSEREERLFDQLPAAEVVPHEDVMELVRRRRLARRGIGWVDAHLLASALMSGARLWAIDADLQTAAADLRVAFRT